MRRRNAPKVLSTDERSAMIAHAKPRTYGMPAAPAEGATLALSMCRAPGCSHWNTNDRTTCRRCGGAL